MTALHQSVLYLHLKQLCLLHTCSYVVCIALWMIAVTVHAKVPSKRGMSLDRKQLDRKHTAVIHKHTFDQTKFYQATRVIFAFCLSLDPTRVCVKVQFSEFECLLLEYIALTNLRSVRDETTKLRAVRVGYVGLGFRI